MLTSRLHLLFSVLLICFAITFSASAQEDDTDIPADTVKPQPKPRQGYYVERQERMDSLKGAIKDRQATMKKSAKKSFFEDTKDIVNVQLFALFMKDFEFGYEHYLSNRFTLGVNAGYKPGNPTSYGEYQNIFSQNGYEEIMAMPFSRSYYGGIAAKFMIKRFLYAGAEFFVRNSHFDNGRVTWEEQETTGSTSTTTDRTLVYVDSLSANVTSTGLKFLFGYRPTIRLSSSAGLVFDFYAGFGFRYKSVTANHQKSYYYNKDVVGSSHQPTDIPEDEKRGYVMPSIQFGIKVGVRF